MITRTIEQPQDSFNRKWESSGASKHCLKCHGQFDWMNPKTWLVEEQYHRRKIRESLEIGKAKPNKRRKGLIRDEKNLVKTNMWTPLFVKLTEKETNAKDFHSMTELKFKHPPAAEAKQDLLLIGHINELSHCYFHEIDEITIMKAASFTKSAGEISHFGADQFRHMTLSKKFETEAKELRKQIAVLARTLASTLVGLKSIKALTNY